MVEMASLLEPVRSTYRVVQVESCSSTSHFAKSKIGIYGMFRTAHRDARVKICTVLDETHTSSWFVVVWAVA